MIECHPLLRPVVQLAKPVVHAVRTWHPRVVGVRHHVHRQIHRILTAATPPQAVMTVCQRVAGPIIAGGLVLLPPASAVPPAGGVGGFPGATVPEYGAPAFAPGYASAPQAYGPGGYGPGIYGPIAGFPGGILSPTVFGSNAPTSTPTSQVPVLVTTNSSPPDGTPPVTTIVTSPPQPGTTAPPDQTTVPPTVTPPTVTPPDVTPPVVTPPTTPTGPGTQPGNDTPPVNTPEPASIAVLAAALAVLLVSRMLWTRRTRR